MPLLEDLESFLLGAGVSAPFFLDFEPDNPDACVILNHYASSFNSEMQRSEPRIQLLTRGEATGNGALAAEALAKQCFDAVKSERNVEINGTLYLYFDPLQASFFVKRDRNHRPYYGFNIESKLFHPMEES